MASNDPDDHDWYLNCPPHLEPVRDLWVSLAKRVCEGETRLNPICDELEKAFRRARARHTEQAAAAWKCPCRKCKLRRVAEKRAEAKKF